MKNILFTTLLFSSVASAEVLLFNDCGFMNYEDFLSIKANGGVYLHHDKWSSKNTYYMLTIDTIAEEELNCVRHISGGRRTQEGYRFTVGLTDKDCTTFELQIVDSAYMPLMRYFSEHVVGPFLYKSKPELDEIFNRYHDRSTIAAPQEYYLSAFFLAHRGYERAKLALKREARFATANPHAGMGETFAQNDGIRFLLTGFAEKKVEEKKSASAMIADYEAANLNNGTCLPCAYYRLLDDNSHDMRCHDKLRSSAILALKNPKFVMGNSLEANQTIRKMLFDFLWDHDRDKTLGLIDKYQLAKRGHYEKLALRALRNATEDYLRMAR